MDDSGELYVPCEDETLDSSESSATDSEDSIILNNVNTISGPRRRQQPDRFGFASGCIEDDQMFTGEISLQEALEGPEKAQWLAAVQDELQSFEKNSAWELVDVPKDVHIVLAQRTVSKVVKDVSHAIVHRLLNVYIKFPSTAQERRAVASGFQAAHGLPDCLGCIDCTHIAIVTPHNNDANDPPIGYKNRKGNYSINTQFVFIVLGIEMDIKNNTALIEALLLEELPDCDEASDAGVSDDEVENVQLPSPRGFDEIFERAIEDVLAEVPPSSPSNEDVLEYPINQVPTSSLPAPSVQPDLPSANNSSHRTNQRLPEPNRKWKKRDLSTSLPEYIADTGVVDDWFAHCTTPTDIFLVLIDDIVDNIVYQSNLYATQKSKVLNLKKEELLTFIGINFFMGYNTRPAWRDHYSSAPDLNNALICKTLPRDRFAIILSHLHCNDSSKMPSGCKDKLYKIRPMIDALNKKFEMVYHGTRELSVDESMIKFKGRSVLKQYLPMKPIKRGYKLWCLADQRGYIKKFQIYQGKDEELNTKFTGYGLGEKVVLELTEQDWSKGKVVYFDNFFTSVALLEKLKTENTYACGTIRSNRKGLPGNMLADSQLKRGDSDHRFSNLDIGYWKWKDNKMVHLVSNFHGNEEATVSHTADRLRALYCIDRKSPKWWHRLFWGLLDIVFVNAYVIHGLIMEQTTVKDFRRSVTQGLMTMKDASQKRKTSTDNTAKGGPSKRRKSDYSTIKDVRLGNRGIHWPTFVENRGRCEASIANKDTESSFDADNASTSSEVAEVEISSGFKSSKSTSRKKQKLNPADERFANILEQSLAQKNVSHPKDDDEDKLFCLSLVKEI
ncbi:unnamed protein product [Danaus chrysippus]|uniref:(African queen) hypothetical protein n=1 Tax=Danaus chrysippus TaxID=151541 RepID=A0A8J2QSD0_9NEOP|nr:unnamed protein product [Danaus chrysippus]